MRVCNHRYKYDRQTQAPPESSQTRVSDGAIDLKTLKWSCWLQLIDFIYNIILVIARTVLFNALAGLYGPHNANIIIGMNFRQYFCGISGVSHKRNEA